MADHIYFGLMYSSGYYNHASCDRVYETFDTCYTCDRGRFTDYMAMSRVDNGCEEYSIFVDGLLVYEYTDINKVPPYRISTGDHSGVGVEISEEINAKSSVVRERRKAEYEAKVAKAQLEYEQRREAIERKNLAELLAKYGTGE